VEGDDALLKACESQGMKQVEVLLKAGADPNTKDRAAKTPIHRAIMARYGRYPSPNAEAVKVLTRGGADVNAADNEGVTPLILAAKRGYTEIVDLLLRSGSDVNRRN